MNYLLRISIFFLQEIIKQIRANPKPQRSVFDVQQHNKADYIVNLNTILRMQKEEVPLLEERFLRNDCRNEFFKLECERINLHFLF